MAIVYTTKKKLDHDLASEPVQNPQIAAANDSSSRVRETFDEPDTDTDIPLDRPVLTGDLVDDDDDYAPEILELKKQIAEKKRADANRETQLLNCDEEERVGYGHPPMKNRFRKGQSGNPAGRPPRAESHFPKSIEDYKAKVLASEVQMKTKGKSRTMPIVEALWLKAADDASKGNFRAFKLLMGGSSSKELPIKKTRKEKEMLEVGEMLQEFIRSLRNYHKKI